MRILVLDGVSEKGVQILKEPGFEVDVINDKLTEEQLVEIMPKYNGVIVRSATKITAKAIENALNLIIIGRAGVGVDNIDLEAATNHGVIVVNAPDGNTIAAAEHTMALMMSLARHVPQANENLKKGKWMRKEFLGVELKGKTLGIIGLGRIGTTVAKRALGFEMDVIGYDPFISEERARTLGVSVTSLDEVFKNSDFITVHMPLSNETKGLCDAKAFEKMKNGVRIINAARGGIVCEKALYDALKSGKVAGAALDVFETEPMTENPLFQFDNMIVTPHLGASTKEAQVNVALDVANEMVAVLQGDMAKTAVNFPPISKEVLEVVKPYMALGEKLGKFIAQICDEADTIEISYSGEIAAFAIAPVTTSVIKGTLSVLLDQTVNMVNAPILAKGKGIKIIETKTEEAEDYTSLITVKAKGAKQEKIVSGTIFASGEPRIVRVDGYHLDAKVEGNMMVTYHIDKPRIIGPVGTLIGEHNINIASMEVGRKEVGGKAIMLLTVDEAVPNETLRAIEKIDGVIDVRFVSL